MPAGRSSGYGPKAGVMGVSPMHRKAFVPTGKPSQLTGAHSAASIRPVPSLRAATS